MTRRSAALLAWRRLTRIPGGAWLFARILCSKAPYFSTIRPRVVALGPGRVEVAMRRRRAVLNHLGTIHAIAMCNLVELAAGLVTDATIPGTHRWIPKGMTVDYLRRATTDLRAIAELGLVPDVRDPAELQVTVDVVDASGEAVLRAVVRMWISRRPVPEER